MRTDAARRTPLLVAIVVSVAIVMLESVAEIRTRYGPQLIALEWFFTLLFTVEYVGRLASVGRPSRYAVSFFGVVDLVSILPTYLSGSSLAPSRS